MKRCFVVALLLTAGCGSGLGRRVAEDASANAPAAPAPGERDALPPVPSPPEFPFDGFWVADGILEEDQRVVGPTTLLIEVVHDRPSCVADARTDPCPTLHFREAGGRRPVTVNNGFLRMEFTRDFPPCLYDRIDEFDGESLIEVTIAGFEIPGTNGRIFDVAIEQRYIFTGITLLSTGTLEHFPGVEVSELLDDTVENSCQ